MGFLDWLSTSANSTTRDIPSSEIARERLVKTIFEDRVKIMALPPERLEEFKNEIFEVIGKYFQIDEQATKFAIEQEQTDISFVIDVAINRLREYNVQRDNTNDIINSLKETEDNQQENNN